MNFQKIASRVASSDQVEQIYRQIVELSKEHDLIIRDNVISMSMDRNGVQQWNISSDHIHGSGYTLDEAMADFRKDLEYNIRYNEAALAEDLGEV